MRCVEHVECNMCLAWVCIGILGALKVGNVAETEVGVTVASKGTQRA